MNETQENQEYIIYFRSLLDGELVEITCDDLALLQRVAGLLPDGDDGDL
jgi:hypothetical protein